MGNLIQNGIPVTDDCIQFHLQPVFYNLRQRISIITMRFLITLSFNFFFGTGYGRRIQLVTVRNRFEPTDLVRNFIWIGHTDFVSGFFIKIRELRKHFFCCAEIQGRLHIRIIISLAVLQDGARLGIFRVKEMGITGCHTKFSQFLCQPVNQLIVFDQLVMGKTPFPFQKRVIAKRLYFKIIVKVSNFQ